MRWVRSVKLISSCLAVLGRGFERQRLADEPICICCCVARQCRRRPLPLSVLQLYRHPELLELQDFLRVFSEYLQLLTPSIETLEVAILRPMLLPPVAVAAHSAAEIHRLQLASRVYEFSEELAPQQQHQDQQQQANGIAEGATAGGATASSRRTSAAAEACEGDSAATETAAAEVAAEGAAADGDQNQEKGGEQVKLELEGSLSEAAVAAEGEETDAAGKQLQEKVLGTEEFASAEAAAADAAAAALDPNMSIGCAERLPFFLGDALLLRLVQLGVLQQIEAMPRAASAAARKGDALSSQESAMSAALWLGVDEGLHKQQQNVHLKRAALATPCGGEDFFAFSPNLPPRDTNVNRNTSINSMRHSSSAAGSSGTSCLAAAASYFECLAGGRPELLQLLRRILPKEAFEQAAALQQQQPLLLPARPLQALDGLPLDLRLLDPLTAPLLLKRLLLECIYTPRRIYFTIPKTAKHDAVTAAVTAAAKADEVQPQQQEDTDGFEPMDAQSSERQQPLNELTRTLEEDEAEQQKHEQQEEQQSKHFAGEAAREAAAEDPEVLSIAAAASPSAAEEKLRPAVALSEEESSAATPSNPAAFYNGVTQAAHPEAAAPEERLLCRENLCSDLRAMPEKAVPFEPSEQPIKAFEAVQTRNGQTGMPVDGGSSSSSGTSKSNKNDDNGCSTQQAAGVEESSEGSSSEAEEDREEDEEAAAAAAADAAAAAGGFPAVEWAVDLSKAEICGIDSSTSDRLLLAVHALRSAICSRPAAVHLVLLLLCCCAAVACAALSARFAVVISFNRQLIRLCARRCSSFWLLPVDIRCRLLQRLQRFVCDGWQGKFFLDAKLEGLGRARLNLLRLKAAAVTQQEEEQQAASASAAGPQAAAAPAEVKTDKVSGEAVAVSMTQLGSKQEPQQHQLQQ